MQRLVVIFAAVLCAAQPSECDPGIYTTTPPFQDTLATTSIAMAEPEVTLIVAGDEVRYRIGYRNRKERSI